MGYACLGLYLLIFGTLSWFSSEGESAYDARQPPAVLGLSLMAVGAVIMVGGMVAHVISEEREFRQRRR